MIRDLAPVIAHGEDDQTDNEGDGGNVATTIGDERR